MSVDELREEFKAAGIDWWICRCSRALYEHSQLGRVHVCARTQSGRFEPRTLPHLDYSNEKGLHRP